MSREQKRAPLTTRLGSTCAHLCGSGAHHLSPLQKWQPLESLSQLEHRGVRWPFAQSSSGNLDTAVQESQKLPVIRPQSTQERTSCPGAPMQSTSSPPRMASVADAP